MRQAALMKMKKQAEVQIAEAEANVSGIRTEQVKAQCYLCVVFV